MVDLVAPGPEDRLIIIGRTGSGKTVDALHNFAHRDYTTRPWIVFNTKGDPQINQMEKIEGVRVIKITDDPPTEPGIYIVKPLPETDDEAFDEFLWKVWSNGDTGLYFDEGYLVPRNSSAFSAILTQGRTKQIPLIVLTQRPVKMNPFALSEAQFIQVKQLTRPDDKKRVAEAGLDIGDRPLPPYYSLWYDVKQDRTWVLKPVPGVEPALALIRQRLAPPEPRQEPLETIKFL